MIQSGPIYDPVIEGNEGKARLSWILFFQQLIDGDNGTFFVPVPQSLAFTGTDAVISGGYYVNSGYADCWIYIQPGTDTTSTAGTTYFELPFDVKVDTFCSATTGTTSVATGAVNANTNRCYPPSWAAITSPITINLRARVG